MSDRRPLNVIAWGIGTVGAEMLTTIIDHRDDLRIVGARVYSDSKAGQDVGILAGRAPIGVAATTDVNAVLELEADCVLYTPAARASTTSAAFCRAERTLPQRLSNFIRRASTRPIALASSMPAAPAAPPCTAGASIPATSRAHCRSRFRG